MIVSLCAAMIGFTKTGVPGLGVLVIPLMAEVFPARASTGIVLPMLMFADIFAIAYYRRQVVWSHLLRIMPSTIGGVVVGYLLLERVSDQQLSPSIGIIVLIMLGLEQFRDRRVSDASVPTQWWFAGGLGLFAGTTTMLANAAGPFMTIYLAAMRLQKSEFMGTNAWYYFVLNWVKVPFSLSLGLINSQSLQFDVSLFPAIAVSALAGAVILKHMPQRKFEVVVQILAAATAVKLIL